MNNLLAIDIHDDCVSGVLLEHGQKTTVVKGYSVAPPVGDTSLAETIATVVRQTGFDQGDCRVAVGAENFFFRNLVLPFADSKQIDKTLPLELEELTSYPIDTFHLDFLTSAGRGGGTDIFAAMVEKGFLVDTLAQLATNRLDPEVFAVSGLQIAAALNAMGPERNTFIVLDVSFKQATLILVDNGQIILVRSLSVDSERSAGFSLSYDEAKISADKPEQIAEIVRELDLSLQQTLVSVGRASLVSKNTPCFITGAVGLYSPVFEQLKKALPLDILPCNIAKQPLLKIEPSESLPWNPALMNRALSLGLWKRKDCLILNFRKGIYKKQRSLAWVRKNLMTIVMSSGLICALVIGGLWLDYSELARKRNALHNEVETIFRETLPEVTRVVNPVQQLKVKINESNGLNRSGAEQGSSIHKLTLLSELSSRIPQTMPVRITRLVADQKDLRIKAETRDFNTVDNVKRELEKSGLFKNVEISSANLAPKGGEVRFELKLEFNE